MKTHIKIAEKLLDLANLIFAGTLLGVALWKEYQYPWARFCLFLCLLLYAAGYIMLSEVGSNDRME